ncbi:hypothetical protein ABID96_002143 [Bacillus sp. OAE603]
MNFFRIYGIWLFKSSKKDLINFLLSLFFIPILLIIETKLINNRLYFTVIVILIALNLFRILEDILKKMFKEINKEISQLYFFILAMISVISVCIIYFLFN